MNSSLDRGVFILSIDTELAWGALRNGQFERRREQYQLTREAIDRLLELMEKYNIQATWAVVGHLFLDECSPVDGVKHPEILRSSYSWLSGDWFDADPCTQLNAAPHWYGKDIVQRILTCKVPQEIGCHTFSHILAGDPECSQESMKSELLASRLEAEKYDLSLRSFVFPNNSVGHLEVLAEMGFIVFRGLAPSWFGHLPGIAFKMGHFLDNLLPLSPPTVLPTREAGLWNLPASYFYPPIDRFWGMVPVALRVCKVKQGLRQAVNRRRIFHLWFHPFNIATNVDRLIRGLEDVFAEVCRYREAGLLDNFTMGELANSLQLKR